MKHSIALNKEIQCESICKMLQKMVNKFRDQGEDISKSVLIIDIVAVTDSQDSLLPKLEYNPNV